MVRFNKTACAAAYEVGLVLSHNEMARARVIHKYFLKCRVHMTVCQEGNTGGNDVEREVQKYKSHRYVF